MNQKEGHVTHIESLKFPTTPGLSPGVGLRKQGLLALQTMPCTQGRVPAEGMALFGKWPGKREGQHDIIMISCKFGLKCQVKQKILKIYRHQLASLENTDNQ